MVIKVSSFQVALCLDLQKHANDLVLDIKYFIQFARNDVHNLVHVLSLSRSVPRTAGSQPK